MKKLITLTVNDTEYEVAVAPNRTLTQVLREDLNLLGTKEGCGVGDCGACTVVLDGKPVNSCLVLAVQADGSRIKTIEGVAHGDSLHPVQETFVELGAIQCGFCTPRNDPFRHEPSREESPPDRARGKRGPFGQPLPVHGVSEDRGGRAGSVQKNEGMMRRRQGL